MSIDQTRTLTTALLAAAMALTAAGAGAQETARARAADALPAAVFEELESVAAEAVAAGIPEEPIFTKALEGLAKRVPTDRLMPAVRSYAGRLGDARAAFGPAASTPLLVAGADALQRGVPREVLRELPDEEGRSPVAVLVLADLVETGVPTERALAVLREAARQRAGDDRVLDIPARVRRLIREGHSAGDAADRVRQSMQRGRGGADVGPPVPPGSEPVTRDRDRTRRSGGRSPGLS